MMVSPETRKQYTITVGIECHVQLKTETKLFAAVGNDARGAEPNTLISHICLGMPGALPVLNEQAVVLATKAALALGTTPQAFSKFDRKHYFYPDLPMGYQITQFYDPIIRDGLVIVFVDGEPVKVRIHEAHLEADAGKSTHPVGVDYSLIDLNRAGTPLLEIVSEPDMHSAQEAKAYARELWLLMRYAGVSDADLYHGNMRFDVNVSVSKTDELGTRTETKNLNSFRSVEKAVEFEAERQIELLEKGEKITQETRGWDEAKQKTFSQRSKEEAHDYRYMPDPDIPPVLITTESIDEARKTIPRSLEDIRTAIHQAGINEQEIESVLDTPEVALFLVDLTAEPGDESPNITHAVAQWVVQASTKLVTENNLNLAELNLGAKKDRMLVLSRMYDKAEVSSTQAKVIFEKLLLEDVDPRAYAEANNLLQVSDEGAIADIVSSVLSDNPKAAEDVKNGEMKAIGFLVGQVMKQSQGKANPGLAQQLIKKQLGL
jgi:aspartyl-tRNA(Asn)/glutamyl-tRNA(Gln) amidotransferase subunit B